MTKKTAFILILLCLAMLLGSFFIEDISVLVQITLVLSIANFSHIGIYGLNGTRKKEMQTDKNEEMNLSPSIKNLKGAIKLADNFDYKKELENSLEDKHNV